MASQIVATGQIMATGRIRHKKMSIKTVRARAKDQFPRLDRSDGDFAIPFAHCTAVFWEQGETELFFQVKTDRAEAERVAAAVRMLVPAIDSMWEGLRPALRVSDHEPGEDRLRRGYPVLSQCCISDQKSLSPLLTRHIPLSPLRSRSARFAYVMSASFCLVGGLLIGLQFPWRESADARNTNIWAIAVAFALAAVSVLIPVVMNWREWARTPVWRFEQDT
jgi:hypothetical protein